MRRVVRHDVARRDLVEHFEYLEANAGLDTADRFLQRVAASCEVLAGRPMLGRSLELRAELAGVRKWRVKDFDNYLIFYVPEPDEVAIIRVLHAASDWWAILGFQE